MSETLALPLLKKRNHWLIQSVKKKWGVWGSERKNTVLAWEIKKNSPRTAGDDASITQPLIRLFSTIMMQPCCNNKEQFPQALSTASLWKDPIQTARVLQVRDQLWAQVNHAFHFLQAARVKTTQRCEREPVPLNEEMDGWKYKSRDIIGFAVRCDELVWVLFV